MLMRHCPTLDWLSGESQRWLQPVFYLGELALCLERQGVSIELVALPFLRLARHRNHVCKGFCAVVFCLFCIATQRVDTGAERHEKSGFPDAFACVAHVEIAPAFFNFQHIIPTIHPEQALCHKPQCICGLVGGAHMDSQGFGFF